MDIWFPTMLDPFLDHAFSPYYPHTNIPILSFTFIT